MRMINLDRDRYKASGLYEIASSLSDRKYVGGTISFFTRMVLHENSLNYGTHPNPQLQFAWEKYGAGSFSFRVLLVCRREDVKTFEQALLDSYVKDGWEGLYNICKDARAPMRGLKFTDEHRRNMSKAIREVCSSPEFRLEASARTKEAYASDPTLRSRVSEGNKRAHADPVVKARHAEAVRISHAKPETKLKLSAIRKGKTCTPEQRAKMSASAKRRRIRGKGVPV